MPTQSSASSSRSASSYSEMPGEPAEFTSWCLETAAQQRHLFCFPGRRLHVWRHVGRRGRIPVCESVPLWTPPWLLWGNLIHCVCMCFRAAQQAPPAEAGSLQEFVRCLWATAERPARDLSRKVNWRLLWRSPALQTAVRSLPRQPTRWDKKKWISFSTKQN